MPTILCIDDQPSNCALVARALTRQGHRVIQASSVRSGIEMVHRTPDLALVLLDLHMPEFSGFDALTVLKGDPATSAIPVLVVSASADPNDEAKARALGATDYVGDPVTDERIVAAVNRILGPNAAHA
jgi:CheY-like chemotaxis protein